MTSKWLGEMFEDDYSETCGENLSLLSMGESRHVKLVQTGSEQKFFNIYKAIKRQAINFPIFENAYKECPPRV